MVYGLHVLREILRSRRRPVSRVYVLRRHHQFREIVQLARTQGIPVYVEPSERLDRMVPNGRHQGVVGVVAHKDTVNEDDLLEAALREPRPAWLVALDGIEDPQNLGAILRTGEAAGVHGVCIPDRRSVGLTATVAKASAGALEYLPIARSSNIGKFVLKCEAAGITSIALDPAASTLYTQIDFRGPIVLVFGREGTGIRPGVLSKCTERARIPLFGKVASLNVSVAVAVVLYEVVRQRGEAR
ncbi:MAG: 23S rRNA (guanosine(2251)-2'-O)-methyltransferase RlmB [Nitrospirae bacterium]|nr:MAG: 23S rRNA (guanosine(2251)-2'-O)-methyltransferase RlmB [Nitrospirota bacterium]